MTQMLAPPPPNTAPVTDSCAHCGEVVPLARRVEQAIHWFCCPGCESVYSLLNDSGLGNYYQLRSQAGSVRTARADRQLSHERFAYLDEAEFRREAGITDEAPALECFLEGAHCTACVWLVERLPQLADSVRTARLDLGRSIVRLELLPGAHFEEPLSLLTRLGYVPHPLLNEGQAAELARKEDRSQLVRLAVAGACAGNIMMLSAALYTGAEGHFAVLFRWATLLVALPSFVWSALPLYRSAWAALRLGTLSIDVPISLALILGYLASVLAVARGTNEIYLDSLGGLIFLLLSSRYVLKRLQRAGLDNVGLFGTLVPAQAHRINDTGQEQNVPASSLRKHDRVVVYAEETFPCDGIVEAGTSRIDASLLTGESRPIAIDPGKPVFAGTRNLDDALSVRLTSDPGQSRLGRITEEIASAPTRRSPSMRTADLAARYFVGSTLITALLVVLFFLNSDPAEGLRRALCLIVVACPCALALATPLALTRAFRKAIAAGALLKRPELIDELAEIETIHFDKTGTLTEGRPIVAHWIWTIDAPDTAHQEVESAVYSIESRSSHPIARALVEKLQNADRVRLKSVTNFKESIGRGVEGIVESMHYAIHRLNRGSRRATGTWIEVEQNGSVVACICLTDQVRAEVGPLLDSWRQSYKLSLLSGDSAGAVSALAKRLSLTPEETHGGMSPEEKAAFVEKSPRSLMIGDGANDALALSRASVGVAVRGSLEVSARAADIVLLRDGLEPVSQLLTLARDTRRLLYRNYALSAIYNLLGAGLAVSGTIGPLFAAIVMPASALTVFLSTVYGTPNSRRE